MHRPLTACLLLAALPAVAEEAAAEPNPVTNVRVRRDIEGWPALIVSPALGFGLPHSVALSGRVETNGLVPFLYTDTLLRLSFDPLGMKPASFDVPPYLVYPTSGVRQRVGFALQGMQTDKVPILTEQKRESMEYFEVEQPTATSDVVFGSVELRPFATPTGPFTIIGAGYMHMARFVGDIDYTLNGEDHADHIVSYTQWTVEPRMMLGVPNAPFSPGLAGSIVYQLVDLFAVSAEVALYNRNGFDFAEVPGQSPRFAEFLFEFTLPIAIDPASVMKLVAPAPAASAPSSGERAQPPEPAPAATEAATSSAPADASPAPATP